MIVISSMTNLVPGLIAMYDIVEGKERRWFGSSPQQVQR